MTLLPLACGPSPFIEAFGRASITPVQAFRVGSLDGCSQNEVGFVAQLQLKGLQLDDEYILSFHYTANREVTVGLGSQTLKQLRPAKQPRDEMLVFTARTTGSDHIDLCMKRTNDFLEVGAVSVEHKASGRLLIAVPLHGNQSADGSECSSHAECASRRCLPSSHICKFQRIPSRVCVPQGGAQDGHACCTNSDCKNTHCHQQETEKGGEKEGGKLGS